RRDINVVPAQAVDLDPPLLIVPTSPRAELRRVIVQVTNNRAGAAGGRVRLRTDAPSLAQIQPSEIPVGFKAKGERATVSFDVRLLPTTEARPNFFNGRLLTAEDLSTEQQAYRLEQRLVSYPHIQAHYLYTPAESAARVFDLRIAPVRVGYIMGSGDEVPQAIERMGLKVTMLTE